MHAKTPRQALDTDTLFDAVEELVKARAGRADRETDLRLLRARHRAGMALMETPIPAGEPHSGADGTAALRLSPTAVPEIAAADLTPAAARAAIGEHGCVLVRGLVPAARECA